VHLVGFHYKNILCNIDDTVTHKDFKPEDGLFKTRNILLIII
jgi:hypothetical protein